MLTTLTDARRALVPPANDRDGPLSPLLLALTAVAGLFDAFSYLVLGQVFVANMTGNVVFLALGVAGARGFSVVAHLAAVASFSVGAVLSGRVVGRSTGRRGRMLAATAAAEVVLVGTALVVTAVAGHPGTGPTRYLLVVLLATSCGLQTGTARRLGVPDFITTVLTRTIATAAVDSRLAGGDGSQVGRRGLPVVAMFGGAVVGAGLILHASKSLSLLVAFGLLVVVTASAGRLARRHPPWDRPR